MAKKCQIARERKRAKLIKQYAERRNALRKAVIDPNLSDEERFEARMKLNKLPRDSAPTRYTRRCSATGVSRAVYRKYQLNRISFREMALEGLLPGVTKASW
jgi:small subunit ribosomal protein S14